MTARATVKSSATLATKVYEQLRREIVSGQHPPGAKLHIQSLCNRLEVGLSPVREALSRLSRCGLVQHEDQRGFSVSHLDENHLDELIRTRAWFNEIGLRESILHGGEEWEEGVLLSIHRLSKLPRYLSEDDPYTANPAWEEAHRAFHTKLISACRSRWLIEYCEQLFDASEFYRNVARVTGLKLGLRMNGHEAIAKAALARDTEAAVKLLNSHLQQTAERVRECFGSRRD